MTRMAKLLAYRRPLLNADEHIVADLITACRARAEKLDGLQQPTKLLGTTNRPTTFVVFPSSAALRSSSPDIDRGELIESPRRQTGQERSFGFDAQLSRK
jgi:hypothetical protein